jgi:hypothetical protein
VRLIQGRIGNLDPNCQQLVEMALSFMDNTFKASLLSFLIDLEDSLTGKKNENRSIQYEGYVSLKCVKTILSCSFHHMPQCEVDSQYF